MAAQEFSLSSLVSDANLVAYYKAESTADSKGANTLTNNNSVTFNPAKFNNGFDLGAANTNKFMSRATDLGIGGNTNFSISFWIKLNAEIASGAWTLMHSSSTSAVDRYCDLNYFYNGGTQRMNIDASGSAAVYYTAALGTSVFHHIVMNRDTSTTNLYVDGVNVASQGLGGGNAGTNTFVIGAANTAGGSPASAIIDDVAVFTRTLTSAEVLSIFNSPTTGASFLLNFI